MKMNDYNKVMNELGKIYVDLDSLLNKVRTDNIQFKDHDISDLEHIELLLKNFIRWENIKE